MAAHLLYMTMETIADFLFGSQGAALEGLSRLFAHPRNRFSYAFAQMAEAKGVGIGLLVAAPMDVFSTMAFSTAKALFALLGPRRALDFMWRSLHLLGVPEGKRGEYYVAHLAVLPEYRRQGVGEALLAWGEQQARRQGMRIVSLTVEIGHEDVRAFYEKRGYVVLSRHETPRLYRRIGYPGVYRLAKFLPTPKLPR